MPTLHHLKDSSPQRFPSDAFIDMRVFSEIMGPVLGVPIRRITGWLGSILMETHD